MDERDLAVDKAANEDVFSRGHRLKDGEDVMTLGVSPPASADGLVDNGLDQPRDRTFAQCENHAMLSNKLDRFGCGHAHVRRVQGRRMRRARSVQR